MSTFLTVKEAAQLVGKSSSSIRRIIYPILQDDQHPDRQQVLPSPEEVLELRLKGENFPWRLSEELLRREVPPETSTEKGSAAATSRSATQESAEMLTMLRRELEIKNQQITQQSEMLGKQMELISSLSERLREGNVLMGSLQQRLAMPQSEASTAVQAANVKPSPKKKSASPETSKPPAKSAPAKKGVFRRLFRSA